MPLYLRVAAAAAALVCLLTPGPVRPEDAKPAPPPGYYEEDVAASNPIRSEQARELDAYIHGLKADSTRLQALFKPDYSSVTAYDASTRPLREAFSRSIGYPP